MEVKSTLIFESSSLSVWTTLIKFKAHKIDIAYMPTEKQAMCARHEIES